MEKACIKIEDCLFI